MIAAIFALELRLRARNALSAAFGLVALTALLGALFPSLGDSIGDMDLSGGFGNLIGGGDLSGIEGWLRAEIVSVYGPVVFSFVAISAAVATTAREEEAGILGLLLAHPVPRGRLVLAKAAAIATLLVGLAVAVFAGMVLGVALAGGGVGVGHLAATALHLLLFSLAVGALALALAAGTGRAGLSTAVAASTVLVMYLVNGLAPTVHAIEWLKYLTFFYYYEHHDPLTAGVGFGGLAVLAAATAALVALAVAGLRARDLRG